MTYLVITLWALARSKCNPSSSKHRLTFISTIVILVYYSVVAIYLFILQTFLIDGNIFMIPSLVFVITVIVLIYSAILAQLFEWDCYSKMIHFQHNLEEDEVQIKRYAYQDMEHKMQKCYSYGWLPFYILFSVAFSLPIMLVHTIVIWITLFERLKRCQNLAFK